MVKHSLGLTQHSPARDFHQAIPPEQIALATRPLQATVAWAALRPAVREHLQPVVKHSLGVTTHSPARDFHQAIPPEQIALATRPLQATVAWAALRPAVREHLQPVVKHSLGVTTHSPARDFHQAILPEQVALARLLPRQAQPYQCSPSQVRASLFRSLPGGRKCNRAARYADHPTLDAGLELPSAEDRHPQRRNRREFVGCDSKNNRLRRKRVCRARPFQILASDKCRCPLRRFAVRDVQSANPECKRAQARKKQASPGARERVE